MSGERITRRRKDIPRLLRERGKILRERILLDKKEGKTGKKKWG